MKTWFFSCESVSCQFNLDQPEEPRRVEENSFLPDRADYVGSRENWRHGGSTHKHLEEFCGNRRQRDEALSLLFVFSRVEGAVTTICMLMGDEKGHIPPQVEVKAEAEAG